MQILVGNKCDMSDRRAVSYARGKALADEYKLQFFETSAKTNTNVDEVRAATGSSHRQQQSWPEGLHHS